MTGRRPNASARTEDKGETRRANRAVEDVIIDLSKAVRGRFERDGPMETRVAEMTPVSSAQGADQQRVDAKGGGRTGRLHTSKEEPAEASSNRQQPNEQARSAAGNLGLAFDGTEVVPRVILLPVFISRVAQDQWLLLFICHLGAKPQSGRC
jgi:hypothetical protein